MKTITVPEDALKKELEKLIDDRNKLAKDLLEIAEAAMPDTYFQNDSRCEFAREVLAR